MTKIAFIGLGNMGSGMCANLCKAGHEVRAFDLNAEVVKAAEGHGAIAAATIADAVKDSEIVVTMLPAGKHVLCEKPIGLTSAEGQQLVDAARAHPELKVMEAFMFRHHPQWQKARQLVSDGRIGSLRTIQSFFSSHPGGPRYAGSYKHPV